MARRASPPAKGKLNILGPKLHALRSEQGIKQVDMCVRLQRKGWDIAPTLYSQIEKGKRSLTDIELSMILKALGKTWSDLER